MGPRIPPIEVVAAWPVGIVTNVRSPWSMYILSAGTTGLAAILTLLRLYYRKRAGQLARDDIVLVAALLCTIGTTVTVGWATANSGWNKHTWELINDWSKLVNILKAAFTLKLLHGATITLGRWAVLLFYSRLLFNGSGIQPGWKVIHHGTVALVLGTGISFAFVSIFQCKPVNTYWVMYEGVCLPEGQIVLFFGSLNGFLDLLVGALPVPIILKLNLPLQTKLSVIALLCLGGIAFVCAVAKCYFIYMSLLEDWDMVWWVMPLWISAICEQNLIIICATLPTLNKPLIARPFRRVVQVFGGGGGGPRSAPSTYRPSQARNSHHIHGMHVGGKGGVGNLSTIGKGDEENLPLRGLVVTREVEMQWSPNANHKS